LLARLHGREPIPQPRAPADVLGEWVDWQRAVALSRALDESPAAARGQGHGIATDMVAGDGAAPLGEDADAALAAECRRVRGALEDAIRDDSRDWTLPVRPRAGEDGTGLAAGLAAVQRHCQGLQRDLQSASGRLRGDLRERLACRDGVAARLASVDAVMEGLLAPREHALLVPVVPALVARFGQLHALQGAGDGPRPGAGRASLWRAAFRAEAREVLLAELDLRFHPIEALLAALHSPRPDA